MMDEQRRRELRERLGFCISGGLVEWDAHGGKRPASAIEIALWDALLSAPDAVPREPTEEMIAVAESLDLGEDQWDYATIWRAMYDAARSAPAREETEYCPACTLPEGHCVCEEPAREPEKEPTQPAPDDGLVPRLRAINDGWADEAADRIEAQTREINRLMRVVADDEREVDAAEQRAQTLASALGRARCCIRLLINDRPVRDLDETLAECDTALAAAGEPGKP